MKITTSKYINLENVPSGSGIQKSGNIYYVIGDDSPFLFSLNKNFEVISKVALIDGVDHTVPRIAKSEKPDFEAMEMIGEKELLVFGSGSLSPQRDVLIRILLEEPPTVEKYQITDLYDSLRNLPILRDSELNIEAAAFHNNRLFLFNRRKNVIFNFDYTDLFAHISGDRVFPNPEIVEFDLPKINGIEFGFSGATTLKGQSKIIFTASVEDTPNAYDDGEILGSIIGMIDIENDKVKDTFRYCPIPNTEENLKVESVTVDEEISAGKTKVILVTDDDLGNSIII